MTPDLNIKMKRFKSYFSFDKTQSWIFYVPQAFASMLGLTSPIVFGMMTSHINAGIAMSIGGLMLSGGGKGNTLSEQVYSIIYTVAAGCLAVFIGTLISGHSILTIIAVPVIAALAGLAGSLSRQIARATTQFTLFMIIAANLGIKEISPFVMTYLFLIGAAWASLLSILFSFLLKLRSLSENVITQPKYPWKLLFRRWRKSLAHFSGWQYVLRITSCLAIAQIFELIWPDHHVYWVLLTVIIVVKRDPKEVLMRTAQRSTGTFLGVAIASTFLIWSPSMTGMVIMIAVFSALRPPLIETNYAVYAVIQTLLVILLLDFGHEPSPGIIIDRLLATLAGCVLALTVGYRLWHNIASRIQVKTESKKN